MWPFSPPASASRPSIHPATAILRDGERLAVAIECDRDAGDIEPRMDRATFERVRDEAAADVAAAAGHRLATA